VTIAVFAAPAVVHRTAEIDGFIGNPTKQSGEDTLPRQAVDFIRQPEGRVLNILGDLASALPFHWTVDPLGALQPDTIDYHESIQRRQINH
jgi:hypothetical protein